MRSRTVRDVVYNNGESIVEFNEFCYQGAILHSNCSAKPAIDKQISQDKKAMFSITKHQEKLGLPLDIQLDSLQTNYAFIDLELWVLGFSKIETCI